MRQVGGEGVELEGGQAQHFGERVSAARGDLRRHENGAGAGGASFGDEQGELAVVRLFAVAFDRYLAQAVVGGEIGPFGVKNEEGAAAERREAGGEVKVESRQFVVDRGGPGRVRGAAGRVELGERPRHPGRLPAQPPRAQPMVGIGGGAAGPGIGRAVAMFAGDQLAALAQVEQPQAGLAGQGYQRRAVFERQAEAQIKPRPQRRADLRIGRLEGLGAFARQSQGQNLDPLAADPLDQPGARRQAHHHPQRLGRRRLGRAERQEQQQTADQGGRERARGLGLRYHERSLCGFAARSARFEVTIPGEPLMPPFLRWLPALLLLGWVLPGGGEAAAASRHLTACVGGQAGPYACSGVDLLEQLDLATFEATNTSDIWGWTDPQTGKEYVLLGLDNGTAFIDVSDPDAVVYLGKLPTHSGVSIWRSIKVYGNYAFIGSEASNHGLQIFDLTELRQVANPPALFQATAHYGGFLTTHTLEIDTQSGFLYSAGSNTCNGGLHIVDIRAPLSPQFAGCFSADGYTHEAQCTVYHGPDVAHQGKEICMACNIDTLTIVDTTNKAAPAQISRTTYQGVAFAHQGWLTEDQRYFLLDDERDESSFGHNTKTYIWDVSNLDAPSLIGFHLAATTAVDHNQYIRGNYVYQSNYEAGVRILRLDNVASGQLNEVAYFDTEPGGGNGTWTNYPYFASGIVVASDIDRGLFVLQPRLCAAPPTPASLAASASGANTIGISWQSDPPAGTTYELWRSFGACPAGPVALENFTRVATGLSGGAFSDTVSGSVAYAYVLVGRDETSLCSSAPSSCVSATTSGVCNAPPAFAGLAAASDQGTARCGIALSWPAATARCGGPAPTYSVYRGSDANFAPAPENRVASGLTGTSWVDHSLTSGLSYAYVVRATDPVSGAEDANRHLVWAKATGPVGPGAFKAGAEAGDPVLESAGGARHLGWEVSGDRYLSGQHSYHSSYVANTCLAIETPPLDLPPGGNPTLSFWNQWNIAPADGGQVQISNNGGASWSRLDLNGGYPATMAASNDACGFPTGEPVFAGQLMSWTEKTANLTPWAGQQIVLRWIFSTDSSTNGPGWWIDDISAGPAIVPGTCLGDTLLWDGFETGNTAAWSLVLP